MKRFIRYIYVLGMGILCLHLIWMTGMKGFYSWIVSFWLLMLYLLIESLVRFQISEKRKK